MIGGRFWCWCNNDWSGSGGWCWGWNRIRNWGWRWLLSALFPLNGENFDLVFPAFSVGTPFADHKFRLNKISVFENFSALVNLYHNTFFLFLFVFLIFISWFIIIYRLFLNFLYLVWSHWNRNYGTLNFCIWFVGRRNWNYLNE